METKVTNSGPDIMGSKPASYSLQALGDRLLLRIHEASVMLSLPSVGRMLLGEA